MKSKPTNIVGIINFHGLPLLVVNDNEIEYISAKPLSDLAGVDWRNTKKAISSGDNVTLYGTTTLKHPSFVAGGGASTPQKDGLYMRLDRARMFLARINTSQMRVQGNAHAADALLELQTEWADVIHKYETNGIVVKKSSLVARDDKNKTIQRLMRMRKDAENQQERDAFASMIKEMLDIQDLPVSTGDENQAEMDV